MKDEEQVEFAIKIVNLKSLISAKVETEIHCLELLKNQEFIIKLFQYYFNPEKSFCFIFTNFIKGQSLLDIVMKDSYSSSFTLPLTKIAFQLLSAIQTVHSFCIVHHGFFLKDYFNNL